MSDALSLNNKWIVITRPEHQAQELSKKLLKVGGCPIHFPLIEIKPNIDLASVKHQLDKLQDYDLIIFVSANAVEQTFDYLPAESVASIKIASVGKKTAQALTNRGVNVNFCPERFFNSEALLATPEFQNYIKGKKIAIIRGEGGREYLRKNLLSLGARADYIDVYKRNYPQRSLQILKDFWNHDELDIILLTSASSVSHFFKLAKNEPWTNKLTLLIGSQRMQQEIPECFQGKILIAEDPSDETLLMKLLSEYG